MDTKELTFAQKVILEMAEKKVKKITFQDHLDDDIYSDYYDDNDYNDED